MQNFLLTNLLTLVILCASVYYFTDRSNKSKRKRQPVRQYNPKASRNRRYQSVAALSVVVFLLIVQVILNINDPFVIVVSVTAFAISITLPFLNRYIKISVSNINGLKSYHSSVMVS